MTALSRSMLLLLALAAGGCAQNAIFELTIELPAVSGAGADAAVPDGGMSTPQFVSVQARANVSDFSVGWAGSDELHAFPLTSSPQTVHISLVTSDAAAAAETLAVRVRFCVSDTCASALADGMPPEARFLFARVFYIGHRTSYPLTIATVPTDPSPMPTMIDKCSVMGCREGTTSSYCTMSGTTHFCEQ